MVDNGSTALPEPVVEQYPGARLLQELKPGPGLARNRGIEAANADISCVHRLLTAVRIPTGFETRFALFNPPKNGSFWAATFRSGVKRKGQISALEAYENVFAYRFKLYIEQHGFSGTGNLVVRRSDFDKVGPFGGIEVAEDIDWGQRARAAGYTFRYVPEMIVFHPARRSLRELFVKWDRHIQHAVNTRDENALWHARWFLRAFAILISPLSIGPRSSPAIG